VAADCVHEVEAIVHCGSPIGGSATNCLSATNMPTRLVIGAPYAISSTSANLFCELMFFSIARGVGALVNSRKH
jgi:hypothetical protein